MGSVGLALFGLIHVRRRVPLAVQMEQNEVAGFFLAVLGVMYGVLLASAVIAAWEYFEEARAVAEREANSVGDLRHIAEGMSEGLRAPVQERVSAYARSVAFEEWPLLQQGGESPTSREHLDALWSLTLQYEPSGEREVALYGKLLDEVQQLNDQHRERLLISRDGIPTLMWAALIRGGIVTVLFTYFFGLKSFRALLAMTALYVVSIGFVLFLIAAVEYPYGGAIAIRPDAMELVISRIDRLERARR
ncbi:MAG TPA: hypothetical protein VFH48_36255 [Chloroflexota bacterium]|nr:hypothetical protein [Chloroflexota bacterium]